MEAHGVFNCGKMRHIFATERGKDSDDAMTYLPQWFCEESKEALLAVAKGEAKVYRKIDGSCGALVRNPETGKFDIYQRFDDKKNKFLDGTAIPDGYIRLPAGENTKVEGFETNLIQHCYYLKKLNVTDKPVKINAPLFAALAKVEEDGKSVLEKDFYSVELVGPNFNRTPGVETNGIAVHCFQTVSSDVVFPQLDDFDQWFAWFKEYFTNHRDEGLIVEHKGRCWKIHGYKFVDLPKKYDAPILL